MSDKPPVIVLFDSDPFYKINLDLILSSVGLEISRVASNSNEINQLIKEMEIGEYPVDIAIISNYLVKDWMDGGKVANRLKNAEKKIQIISYSIEREQPSWSDEHAIKSGLDNEKTILGAFRKVLGVDIKFEASDKYD